MTVWGSGMTLSTFERQWDDCEWLCEAEGWHWVTVWGRGMTVSHFLRQGDDTEWLCEAGGWHWVTAWGRGMTLSDCVRQGDDTEWLCEAGGWLWVTVSVGRNFFSPSLWPQWQKSQFLFFSLPSRCCADAAVSFVEEISFFFFKIHFFLSPFWGSEVPAYLWSEAGAWLPWETTAATWGFRRGDLNLGIKMMYVAV